jgi:lactoylglutathione lyase
MLLVNIDVDDIERGVAFYTRAFGLTLGRRFDDSFVELTGGEVLIYLLRKESGTVPFQGAAAARDFARHWTPVHFDVVVDDFEAAIARAEEAGAVREGAVSSHKWGRMQLFADPFGHGFCILRFENGGYDALRDSGTVPQPTEPSRG